jgi:hypothetical protein
VRFATRISDVTTKERKAVPSLLKACVICIAAAPVKQIAATIRRGCERSGIFKRAFDPTKTAV